MTTSIIDRLKRLGKAHSAETSSTVGPNLKYAFLRWLSLNIVFLTLFGGISVALVIAMVNAVQSTVIMSEVVFILVIFIIMIGFCVVLTLTSLVSIMDKITIREDILDIETETSRLPEGAPPSELLISSLSRLRDSLMKYATSSYGISPMVGFYESRLKRRIDLAFSCVSEALYRRYWDEKKRLDMDAQSERRAVRQPEQFGYKMLNSWILELRDHLVGTRKWFRYSSKEISTLLYFFEDWRAFFKKSHQDILIEYQAAVDTFHDRKEEAAEMASRRRKELIVELLRQLLVGVLLLAVGYLLGLGANKT